MLKLREAQRQDFSWLGGKSCLGHIAALNEGAKSLQSTHTHTQCVAWQGPVGATFQLIVYHTLPVMRDAYLQRSNQLHKATVTHSPTVSHQLRSQGAGFNPSPAPPTITISWNFLSSIVPGEACCSQTGELILSGRFSVLMWIFFQSVCVRHWLLTKIC